MKCSLLSSRLHAALALVCSATPGGLAFAAETVAFFPFDEPVGLYPSSVISDHSAANLPLIIGPGGSIVPGKFGNAFSTAPQPPVNYPAGSVHFGLAALPVPAGRTVAPLAWRNARFAALLTAGENHLRKEVVEPNPTKTGLNLGAFDWTVEFWYQAAAPAADASDAVVFELGEGPRGENDHVTALLLGADRAGFVLVNQPTGTRAVIPSDRRALTTAGRWSHLAFVFDAAHGQLVHYVDGKAVGSPVAVKIAVLPEGKEAYFSLGRDARWEHALPGALDELRYSKGVVYSAEFSPPGTLCSNPKAGAPARPPHVSEPLRFASRTTNGPINLGNSKHLLIDDALFPEHENVAFVPQPPPLEFVFEVKGAMRKHLVAVDDGEGQVRLYAPLENDRLGVFTARDGLHFDTPKLTTGTDKSPNIATTVDAGTPSVFIDPLAPPSERWKLVSGSEERGIYVFTSPDGFAWTRLPTAAISARSASQSNLFYDDQRGQYVGYHRTDIGRNAFGKTERRFVMTVTDSLQPPWPFKALTQADYDRAADEMKLGPERPWYLDNGPLTPGGIGIEWPTVFRPQSKFDPDATDMYVPKAVKYPWAADAYLAFPCIYFHYEGTKPGTREVLGNRDRGRGSGPIETQLMTSRDGVNWSRYPRPAWIGIGAQPGGFDTHQTYMAQGMIRRGDDIWMYSYNDEAYHSSGHQKTYRRGIFRTVQRLDRFVAAQAPYDREATLVSRPLIFAGRKLELNVDTHASGWLQIGIRRPDGSPIAGFEADHCVFVSGNDVRYAVEWLGRGTDLSGLAGQSVQLVIKMRGADLYALQFVP